MTKKSNLSPNAQFVKKVMDTIIMPEMEEKDIPIKANKIISEHLTDGSPEVAEFDRELEQLENDCLNKISGADPDADKQRIVGENYCAKLRNSVRG